jgi:protein SERAC1
VDAATNSYSELSSCVRGIIFLGTPHKGSNKAKWGEQARKFLDYVKPTNPELLKDLDGKSEKLAKIGDSFPSLLNTRGKQANTRIEVICFYEGQPMGKLGKVRKITGI